MFMYKSAITILLLKLLTFLNADVERKCGIEIKVQIKRSDKPRLFLDFVNLTELIRHDIACINVHFMSEKHDGHVCIVVLHSFNLNHVGIEICLLDGSNILKHLKYSGSILSYEYCTSETNTLLVNILKHNNYEAIYPELFNNIIMYVYDIESRYREVYLTGGQFCDTTFRLYNSAILIYDKYPKQKRVPNVTVKPPSDCAIYVINVPMVNPICLRYDIFNRQEVSFYWQVTVSSNTIPDFDMINKGKLIKFDKDSNLTGYWCDDTVREKVLIHFGTKQIEYTDSEPQLFRIYMFTMIPMGSDPEQKLNDIGIPQSSEDMFSSSPNQEAFTTKAMQETTDLLYYEPYLLGADLKIIFYLILAGVLLIMIVSAYFIIKKSRAKPVTARTGTKVSS